MAKPLGATALATLDTPCNPKAEAAVVKKVARRRNEVTFMVGSKIFRFGILANVSQPVEKSADGR